MLLITIKAGVWNSSYEHAEVSGHTRWNSEFSGFHKWWFPQIPQTGDSCALWLWGLPWEWGKSTETCAHLKGILLHAIPIFFFLNTTLCIYAKRNDEPSFVKYADWCACLLVSFLFQKKSSFLFKHLLTEDLGRGGGNVVVVPFLWYFSEGKGTQAHKLPYQESQGANKSFASNSQKNIKQDNL